MRQYLKICDKNNNTIFEINDFKCKPKLAYNNELEFDLHMLNLSGFDDTPIWLKNTIQKYEDIIMNNSDKDLKEELEFLKYLYDKVIENPKSLIYYYNYIN
jgi:hypothetical protein